jgi:superfamily I DNA and/or RNA helicase
MAMGILEFLIKKLTAANQSTKHLLGCITPYKKQVIAINEKLRDKYGMKYRDHVTVNTVDAFQVSLTKFWSFTL